jgi:hypothetical protein
VDNDILDPDGDDITAAKLAVHRKANFARGLPANAL